MLATTLSIEIATEAQRSESLSGRISGIAVTAEVSTPSRFSLSAARAGYVTIPHGATRPHAAGTPVSIASGQFLTNVRLLLARGAVIAGTVRDPNGDPVSGLMSVSSRLRDGLAAVAERVTLNEGEEITQDLQLAVK